jgi:hypothetical protein
MPYVARDAAGQITEVSAKETETATEKLAATNPELQAYDGLQKNRDAIKSKLIASDLQLIRVMEDLITILIDKRIIMMTDFPTAAQAKLANRYDLRSKLADLGGIVSESEEIMLP